MSRRYSCLLFRDDNDLVGRYNGLVFSYDLDNGLVFRYNGLLFRYNGV